MMTSLLHLRQLILKPSVSKKSFEVTKRNSKNGLIEFVNNRRKDNSSLMMRLMNWKRKLINR